ncbi:hypothetical protein [Streptomyces sp. CLV115]|uniref:hypothetical protein n=1 Tax=Streptomyces sp. CLV115 TaxID=3138502 RepID=UPI00406CC871
MTGVPDCGQAIDSDRIEGSVTLFSEPGHLGYTHVDGPHPFGTVLRLPDPFDLDTSGLSSA